MSGATIESTTPSSANGDKSTAAAMGGDAVDDSSSAGSAERKVGEGFAMLLPFARDEWRGFALAGVLAIVSSIARLGIFYVVYLTTLMAVGVDDFDADRLYQLAAIALGLVIVDHLALALSLYISHRSAFAALARLRLRIGDRLGRVPLGFLTSRRSGAIQRTLVDDVERLELFLAHALPDTIAALSVLSFSTVWLFVVDWRLALATIAAIIVAFPIMTSGMRRGSRRMGRYASAMSRMNGSVVEFIRGMPVIRVFNRTGATFAETEDAVRGAARFQSQWGREVLPTFSLFYVVVATNAVVLVPTGIWLWRSGTVDTSTLLFFFVIGFGYTAPVVKLMEFFTGVSHLTYGATEVLALSDAEMLSEAHERVELTSSELVVDGVAFAHVGPDGGRRSVLADISFEAPPGSVTALVGPSGSGKTTLAKLLCRFFDPDEGAVRISGHDLRDVPFDQLMEQMSFVFQETFLFDDTVAANIALGRPDAPRDDIVAAARAASAHEFIVDLPDGYDTRLGERAVRLSGGEQQRIALARAFLKAAPVVVLDEATAFTDPENEAAIQDGIGALIADRTVVIIAHRLSTIVGADQILVLDAPPGEPGRIVERGRHPELIAAGGLYAAMWEAFEDAEEVALGDAVRDGR
ncbi:MAG: ABC transporter ATP-binding protein [Actinomycetota bacterium]